MEKKRRWFSAVKKVLSLERKEKDKEKKTLKWKGCFGKLVEGDKEQNEDAYYSVASAKYGAKITVAARYSVKSMEEIAAIKIQSSFRCYMARRALSGLKKKVRLKKMIEGESIKRQATESLKCMQTHSRVQSMIFARRMRMSQEIMSFQRQLQQKNERELEKLKSHNDVEKWNDSTQTKEKMEANLQSKQEAAQRRERAMAYAYSHQQTWRNLGNKTTNQRILDSNNPHLDWSWMGKWMNIRPWEHKTSSETKSSGSDFHIKCTSKKTILLDDGNRAIRQPSPKSKSPSSLALRDTKLKSFLSTRGSVRKTDEDSRSMLSARSEYNYHRRHSIGSSSIRDNEKYSSTPTTFPSYMALTGSVKAKSRVSNAEP